MEQLCASQEPVRKVARGEITGALAWGQAKAASLIDERVREELGDHEHRQPLPDWLPEPPTTKPQGCADPAPLPEPDLAQLWARPSLARLRDFARSRRVAPLALLGAALARAVAACPAQYVLPPLVGSEGTLNMAVNLVGSSGVGKGGAHAAARDALDLSGFRDSISGDPELFSMGLGSGEGIAHLYAKYDKGEGGLVP